MGVGEVGTPSGSHPFPLPCDFLLILRLVRVDKLLEGELARGIRSQCVMDRVVLLVLRDNQRVE